MNALLVSLMLVLPASAQDIGDVELGGSLRSLYSVFDNFKRSVELEMDRGIRAPSQLAGTTLDEYRVKVWQQMAKGKVVTYVETDLAGEPVASAQNQARKGRKSNVVVQFADQPGTEIWVERDIPAGPGRSKGMRVDAAVIDRTNGVVSFVDPTSRSYEEVKSRFADLPQGERTSTSYAIDHHIKSQGYEVDLPAYLDQKAPLPGGRKWRAVDKTSGAAFQRTFADALIKSERDAGRSMGRSLAGGGPPLGIATRLVIVIAANMLTAKSAEAYFGSVEEQEFEARAVLHQMIEAYLTGDVARGNALRADKWGYWGPDRSSRGGTGLLGFYYVTRMGISGGMEYAWLAALDAALDEMEKNARELAAQLDACRAALKEAEERLAAQQAAVAASGRELKRHVDRYYDMILARMDDFERRMLVGVARYAGRGRQDSPTWGYVEWDKFPAELAKKRDPMRAKIAEKREALDKRLVELSRDASRAPAFEAATRRDLAYALWDYWNGWMQWSVQWTHHGIMQEEFDFKAELARRFAADRQALDARPGVTAADRQRLTQQYMAMERQYDARIRQHYRELYDLFARNTGELARHLKELAPQEADLYARLTDLQGPYLKGVNQQSYTYVKRQAYPKQGGGLEYYTDDYALWAQPSLDKYLGANAATPPAPAPGVYQEIVAWIDGERLPLDGLRVREGKKAAFLLTASSTTAEEPLVALPSMPGRASALWGLGGATPATGEGDAYVTRADRLADGRVKTEQLSVRVPGEASPREYPVHYRPNQKPRGCLNVPERAKVGIPVELEWAFTDGDPKDVLEVRVETGGGEPASLEESGNPSRRRSLLSWRTPGEKRIKIRAKDDLDQKTLEYAVDVAANRPPTVQAISDGSVAVGDQYYLRVTALDPDTDDRLVLRIDVPESIRMLEEECQQTPGRLACTYRMSRTTAGNMKTRIYVRDLANQTATIDL